MFEKDTNGQMMSVWLRCQIQPGDFTWVIVSNNYIDHEHLEANQYQQSDPGAIWMPHGTKVTVVPSAT